MIVPSENSAMDVNAASTGEVIFLLSSVKS